MSESEDSFSNMPSERSRAAIPGPSDAHRLGASSPTAGRIIGRLGAELIQSQERNEAKQVYEGDYFGDGHDPLGDRQGRSGYARYDRVSSNADVGGIRAVAHIRWREGARCGVCHRVRGRSAP